MVLDSELNDLNKIIDLQIANYPEREEQSFLEKIGDINNLELLDKVISILEKTLNPFGSKYEFSSDIKGNTKNMFLCRIAVEVLLNPYYSPQAVNQLFLHPEIYYEVLNEKLVQQKDLALTILNNIFTLTTEVEKGDGPAAAILRTHIANSSCCDPTLLKKIIDATNSSISTIEQLYPASHDVYFAPLIYVALHKNANNEILRLLETTLKKSFDRIIHDPARWEKGSFKKIIHDPTRYAYEQDVIGFFSLLFMVVRKNRSIDFYLEPMMPSLNGEAAVKWLGGNCGFLSEDDLRSSVYTTVAKEIAKNASIKQLSNMIKEWKASLDKSFQLLKMEVFNQCPIEKLVQAFKLLCLSPGDRNLEYLIIENPDLLTTEYVNKFYTEIEAAMVLSQLPTCIFDSNLFFIVNPGLFQKLSSKFLLKVYEKWIENPKGQFQSGVIAKILKENGLWGKLEQEDFKRLILFSVNKDPSVVISEVFGYWMSSSIEIKKDEPELEQTLAKVGIVDSPPEMRQGQPNHDLRGKIQQYFHIRGEDSFLETLIKSYLIAELHLKNVAYDYKPNPERVKGVYEIVERIMLDLTTLPSLFYVTKEEAVQMLDRFINDISLPEAKGILFKISENLRG